MENQHRHINGYRDLSQDEIDLMNEIKSEGERIDALCVRVREHLQDIESMFGEFDCTDRNPHRWAAIAATDFQTGLMALTRAVARPTSF